MAVLWRSCWRPSDALRSNVRLLLPKRADAPTPVEYYLARFAAEARRQACRKPGERVQGRAT